MREAIGSAWIFNIVLVFIVLFTGYLAISVNYAKAFKIKNHIVTMLENSEGYKKGSAASNALNDSIERYLVSEGYTAHGQCPCNASYNGETEDTTTFNMVACIGGSGSASSCPSSGSSSKSVDCAVAIYEAKTGINYSDTSLDENNPTCAHRTYYKVTTFFRFDLPVISTFTTFKVNGETKTIYDFSKAPATCTR